MKEQRAENLRGKIVGVTEHLWEIEDIVALEKSGKMLASMKKQVTTNSVITCFGRPTFKGEC